MKRFLLVLASVILFASCEQDVNVSVTTDIGSYVFDRYGGEVNAVVFSNADWTATCEAEGVTVTPSSGHCGCVITISVPENSDVAVRQFPVKITGTIDSNSSSAYIYVSQKAVPFVLCKEDFLTVGAEGGTARFHVNSSDPWHVAGVTVSTAAGSKELAQSEWPLIDPEAWECNSVEVDVRIPAAEEALPKNWTIKLELNDFPGEAPALLVVEQK